MFSQQIQKLINRFLKKQNLVEREHWDMLFMNIMIQVALLLVSLHYSLELVGYSFEDNKVEDRFIQENGEMTFELPRIPTQIAACFSFFVNYNRYSSIVPIMDFRTSYGKEYMEFFYGEMNKFMLLSSTILSQESRTGWGCTGWLTSCLTAPAPRISGWSGWRSALILTMITALSSYSSMVREVLRLIRTLSLSLEIIKTSLWSSGWGDITMMILLLLAR